MSSIAIRRPPRSLVQGIVDSFSERIRRGALKAGDKLPTEAEIMRDHGVSRTVVREAISRLHAAGVARTRHGIGTFVQEPATGSSFGFDPSTLVTLRDILAVMELRVSLETEAAGLAAVRRTDVQLEEMRQVIDAMQASAESGGDTSREDFQFHVCVAAATGNRYFREAIRHIGTTIIPRARLNTARLVRADAVQYGRLLNREHRGILDAIGRRDVEAARKAMRTHLGNSRERLRRAHEEMEAKGS